MRRILASTLSISTILSHHAHAATVSWTQWLGSTAGNPGSANGAISSPGITVTYNGQTIGLSSNSVVFTPANTFSGGTVSNNPSSTFNAARLTGGSTPANTLTFSAPISNPVMAIWSLGASSNPASFDFTSMEPFTIESGGPSSQFGGKSITASGNRVLGSEGNGVIQFNCTFSQLTWTNPVAENYYAFTVGAFAPTTGVPEPGGWLLVAAAGLVLMAAGKLKISQ